MPYFNPAESAFSLPLSCDAILKRVSKTREWNTPRNSSLLSVGLDYLTLGRAALYKAILEKKSVAHCEPLLERAVDQLLRAARQDEFPKALLTRAWMRRLSNGDAADDLNNAFQIAERGSMCLHIIDIHLYRARLFFDARSYPWKFPELI